MTDQKGFTLIEILIAIVLIGILTAIGLPSFLAQTAKARETDARQQISTFLVKQQIYYNEKSEFAAGDNWMGKLGMSNIKRSGNYDYNLLGASGSEFIDATVGVADPKKKNLKAYLGAVVIRSNAEEEPEFISIICRAKVPNKAITAADLDFSEGLRCPNNAQLIR